MFPDDLISWELLTEILTIHVLILSNTELTVSHPFQLIIWLINVTFPTDQRSIPDKWRFSSQFFRKFQYFHE